MHGSQRAGAPAAARRDAVHTGIPQRL